MARNSLKNVVKLINRENKDVPIEKQFLDDLCRSIELTDAKTARKPSKTFKPSSMNCVRQMYYQLAGVERDEANTSYTLVGITNAGSDIHERIQKAVLDMKNNGIDCEYVDVADYVRSRNLDDIDIVQKSGMETKLYNHNLNMSFLCDGIIRYQGRYYILELKTETSNKFWQRKGVDPHHYNQGTAYSLNFGLDDVIFVYISRDTLNMKSFLYHVTDDMRKDLCIKMAECTLAIDMGTVPNKPESVDRKTCEYCAYRKTCDMEDC